MTETQIINYASMASGETIEPQELVACDGWVNVEVGGLSLRLADLYELAAECGINPRQIAIASEWDNLKIKFRII